MNPSQAEREAIQLAWKAKNIYREPTADEEEQLLVEIRERTAQIEQDVINYSNRKLGSPSRSGLWSNLAPQTVGYVFLMILGAVGVIWLIVTVANGK